MKLLWLIIISTSLYSAEISITSNWNDINGIKIIVEEMKSSKFYPISLGAREHEGKREYQIEYREKPIKYEAVLCFIDISEAKYEETGLVAGNEYQLLWKNVTLTPVAPGVKREQIRISAAWAKLAPNADGF